MSLVLILGGARSGKSAFAEGLMPSGRRHYIATGEARDDEMAARIALHQARRGEGWETIEAPRWAALDVPGDDAPLLLDCLTLWLSNAMEAGADWEAEASDLLAALAARDGPCVAVSNEIGMGLVPMDRLSRAFRDAQGRLNQMAAERASRVAFVAAGLPLWLKGGP